MCLAFALIAIAIGLFATPVWAQRELTDIPIPNPQLEMETFQMGDGWQVELFAGDPALAKPIHMNWDAQGRLWVASSETYPQIKPGESANDKILVLVDDNRDGESDRTIVFADKLLIPTGVLPANDGPHASAYVANSDQLLYLVDRDGDLIADERHVILSGFGTEDTHHLLHSLRWGHDGWIYMNQSIYIHSHIETPWGVQRLNGGGIWRYHPGTKRLEVYARGFVNTWGTHFDRYGQVFATDGAYSEGINYVFPGSVFVTAVGGRRFVAGLNPGSPKHCGLEILSGSHWPESLQGNMITNDFRAHRVCRFQVNEDRSGYESIQQQEVIKTPHVAFRPIDAKQGLDGALYIADWYNPIIQHGEVDFRDPRRDRTHGRIWRVTHRDQKPTTNEPILPTDPLEKNLQRLADDADLTRLFAGQAIHVRLQSEPGLQSKFEEHLQKLLADPKRELELLQWLWLVEAKHEFPDEVQQKLLASKNGRVRAAAVRSLAHRLQQELYHFTDVGDQPTAEWLSQWCQRAKPWITDNHPRVRLECVRLLSLIPSSEAADLACQALSLPMDRFLDFALWQTMRDLKSSWLPAFQAGEFQFGGQARSIAFALQAIEEPSSLDAMIRILEQGGIERVADALELMRLIAEIGQPNQQAKLLDWVWAAPAPTKLPKIEKQQQANLIQSLLDSSKRRKQPIPVSGPALEGMLKSIWQSDADNSLGKLAARGLGQWQVASARQAIDSLLESPTSELRQVAVQALAAYGDESAKQRILSLVQDKDTSVANTALQQLAELDLKAACQTLCERWENWNPSDKSLDAVLQAVVSKKTGSEELLNALTNRKLPTDVGRSIRSTLRSTGSASPELMAAIDQAAGLAEAKWTWSESLRDHWLDLLKSKGDPARGELIYRRAELQCIQCHQLGGVGGAVGPDLSSIGANAPADYLIEALIAPAAKVKEGYHAKLIRTDDDEIVTGIPVRETDTDVVVRGADGKEKSILKASIVESKDSRSLMPDGLLDSLSQDEAIDLVHFITELGKIDGKAQIANDGSIRSWQWLTWTQSAHTTFNRNSLDSVSGDQKPFAWQPTTSLISGQLPLDGLAKYQPHADVPPTTFLQTRLRIVKAGVLQLDLGNYPKQSILVWVNDVPTPVVEGLNSIMVPEGDCTLYFGINRKLIDSWLSIRITPESTAKFEWAN